MNKMLRKPSGFTLVELLIMILIIGVLAALTVSAMGSAKAGARDARRLSDIRQLQSALELYFCDEKSYPSTAAVVPGQPLLGSDVTKTYMPHVPANPEPQNEGACRDVGNYQYAQADEGRSYIVNYCLARSVNGLTSGPAIAKPHVLHTSAAATPASEPEPNPTHVSAVGATYPGTISFGDGYVYSASGSYHKVQVFNVTNPTSPSLAFTINDGDGGAKLNSIKNVSAAPNRLYVAGQVSSAVEILDRSNPASLSHLGSYSVPMPNVVAASGNYIYIGTQSDGFRVVDVSNPASPVLLKSLSTVLGGSCGLKLSGNYAYVVSCTNDGLDIVDISDPANMVRVGRLTHGTGGALLDSPYAVDVVGNYAYIASYISDALEIVDVSNPANPVHKGSIVKSVGGALLDGARDVKVVGRYAYVLGTISDALEVVDVSDPANPVHKTSLTHVATGPYLDAPQQIQIVDNYAYIGSSSSQRIEIVKLW